MTAILTSMDATARRYTDVEDDYCYDDCVSNVSFFEGLSIILFMIWGLICFAIVKSWADIIDEKTNIDLSILIYPSAFFIILPIIWSSPMALISLFQ